MNPFVFLIKVVLVAICFSACSKDPTEVNDDLDPATVLEQATANFEAVEDGRLWVSEADSTQIFVYDGGDWRHASEIEIAVGQGCVNSVQGSFSSDGVEKYVCVASQISENCVWKAAKIEDYPKDLYFKKSVEYGTVQDERDGQVYKTVVINGKTWMAENLSYDTRDNYYQKCSSLGCEYSWSVAMVNSKGDSIGDTQGICMDGWHIPDTTEWNELLNAYELIELLSEVGWSSGNNETGLSLVPYRYDPRLNTSTLASEATSRYAYLVIVTSNRQPGSSGKALVVNDGSVLFSLMGSSKNCVMCRDYEMGVVRCVKNPK